MKKALVLYSGGLDSRLVIRLLQDQDFQITALYFALPFGCGCSNMNCNLNLIQREPINLKILDVHKEPLLSEYLKILKSPKYGAGAGINPCKDCKIFMLKKAKEYANKHKIQIIATGEVIGQRPMSQVPSAIKTIDEELGFEILRPLCAKKLKETSFEKSGLVDRNKLLKITGRGRKEQMKLAEKYKIKYPSPGGGCLLCEKVPASRIKHLLEKNLITEKTLPLTTIGRHFFINDTWFVVARNAKESEIISTFKNHIPDDIGKPSVYMHQRPSGNTALELQEAYSTGDNEEKRNKFTIYQLSEKKSLAPKLK
ncbi:tRNA 4-thiouridine(8) synthase ThiI [Candidatus Pacearchaeota archaeon]|nr:tRNA 4-thiouridine(8) synthase ThiI [Candidatus Pacearchaeota archaeon]